MYLTHNLESVVERSLSSVLHEHYPSTIYQMKLGREVGIQRGSNGFSAFKRKKITKKGEEGVGRVKKECKYCVWGITMK